MLAIMPWDFLRLTPMELDHLLYGAAQRQRSDWHRTGLLGLWLTAPYSKRRRKLADFVRLPKLVHPDLIDIDTD